MLSKNGGVGERESARRMGKAARIQNGLRSEGKIVGGVEEAKRSGLEAF